MTSEPTNESAPQIRFGDAARLELDELLEQLVARARDVQDTQGRLRGLLRAYLAVARADDLDVVLRHIVEAARELVSAQYAALGVIVGGRLIKFVHTGMDEQTVAEIGRLPEGKGLLGLLVDYPQSLRLGSIADDVASVGFPDNHPPMGSFLGVPIRVGDRVFGNLYLTEKRDSEPFTKDDEELVQALAAAAATAIENATLLAESRRRQGWQTAMMEITLALLGGTGPQEALHRLVDYTLEALAADGVAINTPAEEASTWRVAVTAGSYVRWQDVAVPLRGSITAAAIEAGDLVTVAEPAEDSRTTATAHLIGAANIGETVAVPLRGEHGVAGVLVASRPAGQPGFDPLDRELIRSIAAHAGLAIELAQVRRYNEDLRRNEDRAQIAEKLRRDVIQQMFAHSLALHGIAGRAGKSETSHAIESQINQVDVIIRNIRAAVFSLNPAATGAEDPQP